MRTAIVKREDLAAFVYQQYRAMAAVHDEPSLDFELAKAARVHEIRDQRIDRRLIRRASVLAPFSKAVPRMSIRPVDIAKPPDFSRRVEL